MNILDLVVLAIIGLCAFTGYRRGLIMTVFRLVSFFISILLANRLYPYVSQWLRKTPLYGALSDMVINSLGLRAFFETQTANTQAEMLSLLESLPLPDVLRGALLNYNTPDIYELLNVRTMEEYVGGYFANIALNILSMIAVFILVWLLMRVLGSALNIIGRLPVIKTFNRAGGLAAGFVMGLLLVWVGFMLINLLFVNSSYPGLVEQLNTSLFARWLYENNWLTGMVTKV